MNSKLLSEIKDIDTSKWKEISFEYGSDILTVCVPENCEIIGMKEIPILSEPRAEYEKALSHPIGCPALAEIVRSKGKPLTELTVAVTVSDITRPVPYSGQNGYLRILLAHIEAAGILRKNITIVIGNGMHRPSTAQERIKILGEDILQDYPVLDHDCDDESLLTFIGKSTTGGDIFVNTVFYRADLRIATGLVESHFMAGLSGGRKAICPGLVDKRTIEKFHSPAFLESSFAQNLILKGNPCHEESLTIARTVGVDFIFNTTLDRDMRLTGVFAGDLEAAHKAACDFIRNYVSVPIEREYEIVLTHGSYVGRNHYQAVKAAHNALPAIRKGGIMIIATNNCDKEPIGGPEYKSLLHMLKIQGVDHYMQMIEAPGWRFTKDQWEPEMWGKVFRKINEKRFFYCTHTIPREDYSIIPGQCGLDLLMEERIESIMAVRDMIENALRFAVADYRERGIEPTIAFIREGPYAIPYLKEIETNG